MYYLHAIDTNLSSMEICVPEIIAFYGLGELELAGSIHTVIGGIRSAALSELTSEQKEMVLKMKD